VHIKPSEFKDRHLIFQGLTLDSHISELRVDLAYAGPSSCHSAIVLDNEIIPAIREAINNRGLPGVMPDGLIDRLKIIAAVAEGILNDQPDALCIAHVVEIRNKAMGVLQANEFEQAELSKGGR